MSKGRRGWSGLDAAGWHRRRARNKVPTGTPPSAGIVARREQAMVTSPHFQRANIDAGWPGSRHWRTADRTGAWSALCAIAVEPVTRS